MGVLSELKPAKVFEYFEAICSVPHGSGNTAQISELCASFAEKMGLKYVKDNLNNLIIYKPGSKGLEDAEPVILQGHMDMVCAKTETCPKDMAKDGLDLYIDGEYIRAKDTSLGGDDGIAVAIILAILADDTLTHPPIEAVFTVDEEVGMDGAAGLDMSLIKGRRMLNLDSEEEGVFTVSCAGGMRTDCVVPAMEEPLILDMNSYKTNTEGYTRNDTNDTKVYEKSENDGCLKDTEIFNITINGLIGGHSGCEIDKGRGNAIKLMSRFLYRAYKECESLRLIGIEGGKFDNVICNNCTAKVAVEKKDSVVFENIAKETEKAYKAEFAASDPDISLKIVKLEAGTGNDNTPGKDLGTEKEDLNNSVEKNSIGILGREDTIRFIRALFLVPQGIAAMSSDIKGLVQTSSNIGIVRTTEEGLKFSLSVRSSITSQKLALRDRIEAAVESQGGVVSVRGDYPGWAFRKDSPVRDTLSRVYEKQTGKKPVITAIHAGLECGLFSEALTGLDCVSIGPELKDIHSVGEKLGIASVGRLYELVVNFLKEI